MARDRIPRFGPLFWSTFVIASVLIAAYVLWLVVPPLYEGWTRYRLVQQLRQGDIEEREYALSQLRDRGVEPVDDLIDMLDDPDVDGRVLASNALIWSRPKRPEMIRPLIEALADENEVVRWNVAYALGDIGAHSDLPLSNDQSAAGRALRRAATDPDERVRGAAMNALGVFGTKSPASVPALLAGLKDKDCSVRLEAAWALLCIDSQYDSQAVPVVLQGLSAKEKSDRRSAVSIAQQLGPRAKDTIPQLIDLLNEADWELRSQVAEALQKIAPK